VRPPCLPGRVRPLEARWPRVARLGGTPKRWIETLPSYFLIAWREAWKARGARGAWEPRARLATGEAPSCGTPAHPPRASPGSIHRPQHRPFRKTGEEFSGPALWHSFEPGTTGHRRRSPGTGCGRWRRARVGPAGRASPLRRREKCVGERRGTGDVRRLGSGSVAFRARDARDELRPHTS
jgi:hypothetical protein